MGWITLNDGAVVHTQALNPNPLVGIETMETKTTGGITYVTQNYVYKDGTKQSVTLSYNNYPGNLESYLDDQLPPFIKSY